MDDKEPTILSIKQKYEEGTKLFAHIKKTEDADGFLVPVKVSGIDYIRFLSKGFYVVFYTVGAIVPNGGYGKNYQVAEGDLYTIDKISLFLTQGV